MPDLHAAAAHIPHSVACSYLLQRHLAERPAQIAIVDGATGETVDYAALHARVERLAGALSRHGVAPGERVACLAANGAPYLELFLALAWLGAVIVPLNTRHSAAELAFVMTDAGVRGVLADAGTQAHAEAALASTPGVGLRILAGASAPGWTPYAEVRDAAGPVVPMDPGASGDTLCMLLYTSGTTGRPKGCMIAQRAWIAYAVHMASCFGMGDADTTLGALPLFHVAGFGTAVAQLVLGGTVVTVPRADPALLCELAATHAASIVFLVPGISEPFVGRALQHDGGLPALRTFISGAGVERRALIERVEDRLGARFFGIYGQTEAGGKVTWVDGATLRADPASYGRVMPFFDYRLLDDAGAEVAPGDVGELCVRGSGVMDGYWNNPSATAEALAGGWLHTGDLFVRDAHGRLRMVDRKKYLIKTGGENVYPQEVEQVLLQHPGVADVAVIGLPDPVWGEVVAACVVPAAGATPTPQELADWVGARIAGYKKPRRVAFVPSLARNASGKIVKTALREHFEGRW